jgi:hypothetical protein
MCAQLNVILFHLVRPFLSLRVPSNPSPNLLLAALIAYSHSYIIVCDRYWDLNKLLFSHSK